MSSNINWFWMFVVTALLALFYRWLWCFWRKQSRFWQNHSEHWKRMYDRKAYGVPYDMPHNFNTAKDPFEIEFEPQDWGAAEHSDGSQRQPCGASASG